MPSSAYLAGGTGLTVHLLHRVSRDLDFFCEYAEDLEELAQRLNSSGRVVFDQRDSSTLTCTFDDTKVQVFNVPRLALLEGTTSTAGLKIASVRDILAMKLKALIDRGEMRDYFDLMMIEKQAGLTVEYGLTLAVAKFHPVDQDLFTAQILRGLRTTSDVGKDPTLPVTTDEIAQYWERRARGLPRS